MTTEQKHTPGPWRVANDVRICTPGPWVEAYDEKGRLYDVAQVNYGETLVTDPDLSEACANAELIARAPDLLAENERLRELLTLALPYVEEGEEFNGPNKPKLSRSICAAIAKAEGK